MLTDSLKAHWPVRRLPDIAHLDAGSAGWGFFLCTRKELRTGRQGTPHLHIVLQDRSGTVAGRLLEDVDRYKEEFDAGEFVRAQGRADRHNQRVELVIESIRRINPEQDRTEGFREADYVRAAPRPVDEMWAQLQGLIAGTEDADVRRVLDAVVTKYEDRLRVWPAAVTVHHAYRSGLLEHLLKVADVGLRLAARVRGRQELRDRRRDSPRHRQSGRAGLRPGDLVLTRGQSARSHHDRRADGERGRGGDRGRSARRRWRGSLT